MTRKPKQPEEPRLARNIYERLAALAALQKTLKAIDVRIMVKLLSHCTRHGDAWPSIESIANSAGCSPRHANRRLKAMDVSGLARVVKRGGGRNKPATRRINLPFVGTAAPQPETLTPLDVTLSGQQTLTPLDVTLSESKTLTSGAETLTSGAETLTSMDVTRTDNGTDNRTDTKGKRCENRDQGGSSDDTKFPGFDRFWEAYPEFQYKGGRQTALAIWKSEHLEAISTQILEALDRWNQSPDWAKDNRRFIPSARKWLKEERWQHPPEPVDGWTARELTDEELSEAYAGVEEQYREEEKAGIKRDGNGQIIQPVGVSRG